MSEQLDKTQVALVLRWGDGAQDLDEAERRIRGAAVREVAEWLWLAFRMTPDKSQHPAARVAARFLSAPDEPPERGAGDDPIHDPYPFDELVAQVENEILRSDERHGAQLDRDEGAWLSILVEEVGEVAKEVNEFNLGNQADFTDARKELIQVAAVALRMIRRIDCAEISAPSNRDDYPVIPQAADEMKGRADAVATPTATPPADEVCEWTEYDEGCATACGNWAFSYDPSMPCDCGQSVRIKPAEVKP